MPTRTPAQRLRHNAIAARSARRRRAAKAVVRAAAKAERLRLYPWLRKIPKAERVPCQTCFEVHAGFDANACRRALGLAQGQRIKQANRDAKAAWVCPPCPMPQEKER